MIARSIRKSAFTLIETLVVVFIIAIIVAITIPAVLSGRESARRVQCLNNLKSIALATNSHLDQKNYYPRQENGYSAFVFMLPFLEQAPLYNAFNLTLPRHFAHLPSDVNFTAYSTTVSVFVCPSDIALISKLGPNSYGANQGTGLGQRWGRPDNGPFAGSAIDSKIRDALVRDGLANTVAVSEFCHTQGRATARNKRAVFQLGPYRRTQFDTMVSDCSAVNIDEQAISPVFRGFCWAFNAFSDSEYDHNLAPNHHTCACNGGALLGVWTASSNHPNGVNCAHLDGHVSFVSETINTSVWRALGTINGGEIIPSTPD